QSVHMAAGEAWIFDNWREHKVENPTPDERIHLVADTAGTSVFWRLVDQGQTENFEQQNPDSRLIAFDPAARPKLMIERFNIAPVMPPAEVEQLAFDLLADLASADERPEFVAAVGQFVKLIVDLCHDWRSLWSLCGDAPETRGRYEQLLSSTRGKVSRLPPLRVASTGYSAQAVLNARLLAHMLGGVGDTRQEATEFNVAAAIPPGTAPSSSAAPGRAAIIERPIIILSAPRAGSTLLFETLAGCRSLHDWRRK